MSESKMSDARFGKIFGAMLAAMVGLTIVLIIIANIVGSTLEDELAARKAENKAKELAARIQPIGQINIGQVASTAATPTAGEAEAVSGESVYNSACAACHAQGVAGAPKFGAADDWTNRAAQGKEVLYDHAINGYQGSAGYMPPKGGNAGLSDDDVKAAVDHIMESIN